MRVPMGAMQTPVRPQVEVEYCQRLHDALKAKNDYYRTEGAPPVTQLEDYLFVGSIPSDETAQYMQQLGITHVINLVSVQCPTRPYIYNVFGTTDLNADDTIDYYILMHHYEAFASIVDNVRANGGRVFVHCYAGVNRSVALCVAYLLEHHDVDLLDIVKSIHNQGRYYILDNVGFQQQLVEFYIRDVLPNRDAPSVVRFGSMDATC
jgi:protein tyrosine phosphatase